MANHASALKRHRQSLKRRARNRSGRTRLRTEQKKLLAQIVAADQEAANEQFRTLQKLIDRAAGQGLIHKNKAARIKSRAQRKINSLA